LAPHITGRVNDDYVESKRVEVFRLPLADNQAAVRFRFMLAGGGSWYWAMDNFGLYTISPPVITTQPAGQTIDAGAQAIFTVAAISSGNPTYQWSKDGTASTAPLPLLMQSIQSHPPTLLVLVVVRNSDGPTTSASATLTVVTVPQITIGPRSQVGDANAPIAFAASGRGGRPLEYTLLFNGGVFVSGSGGDLNYIMRTQTSRTTAFTVCAQ